MLLPAPHQRARWARRWVICTDLFCARARAHPVLNSMPLMGRWDSGRLVDLDQLDNPEPSRADRERLLWSQNGARQQPLDLYGNRLRQSMRVKLSYSCTLWKLNQRAWCISFTFNLGSSNMD